MTSGAIALAHKRKKHVRIVNQHRIQRRTLGKATDVCGPGVT